MVWATEVEECHHPGKILVEKNVVVGSLENTNNQGDGRREMRRAKVKEGKFGVTRVSGEDFKIIVNIVKILPIRQRLKCHLFWQTGDLS